jgi:hypothetical protein
MDSAIVDEQPTPDDQTPPPPTGAALVFPTADVEAAGRSDFTFSNVSEPDTDAGPSAIVTALESSGDGEFFADEEGSEDEYGDSAMADFDVSSEGSGESELGDALERVVINKIEVLSNRLVPGSDGSIEHVVIANNAVSIVRSSNLRGRVRVTKDDILIGGVSSKILLTGLDARVDTVRHLVGGEASVHGALFLAKQRNAPVKHFGTTIVGSPKAVIQYLIEAHCAEPQASNLTALARELDGIFLPFEKLSRPA